MVKCKKLFVGCGLAVMTCVMWLVTSCTQSEANSLPSQPIKLTNSPVTNSSTTTKPSTLNTSTIVIRPTTTSQSPIVSSSTPAETPSTTIELPIVSTPTPSEGQITPANIDNYLLYINGLVNNLQSLSYAQILALPSTTQSVEIACPDVINEVDQWTGVPISTLLNAAGLMPEASIITLTGTDGYSVELALETALNSGVFLAYQINGQTLSPDRGYPLRLVISGRDGGDWLRWVTNIEVKPALVSFSNSPAIIQKLSRNIPTSGSKLCSCLLSATIVNYRVVQDGEPENGQNNSL